MGGRVTTRNDGDDGKVDFLVTITSLIMIVMLTAHLVALGGCWQQHPTATPAVAEPVAAEASRDKSSEVRIGARSHGYRNA